VKTFDLITRKKKIKGAYTSQVEKPGKKRRSLYHPDTAKGTQNEKKTPSVKKRGKTESRRNNGLEGSPCPGQAHVGGKVNVRGSNGTFRWKKRKNCLFVPGKA